MSANELLQQLQKLVLTHGDAQVLIGDYKLIEHIGHKIVNLTNKRKGIIE